MSEILITILSALTEFWNILTTFLAETWWFWFLIILFPVVKTSLLYWRQLLYERDQKYVLLEMNVPREILKNPRGMEQFFSAIHTLCDGPISTMAKYWNGVTPHSFSLEIVSFGGQVHFYIRTYHKYKSIISSALLSYYPDVEIVEVEDYVNRLPTSMIEAVDKGYNIWGTEMILKKPAAYPIKTYKDFETPDEELQFDPMSTFLEGLSKLEKGEIVGIQMVTVPSETKWNVKYKDLLADLRKPQSKGVGEDEGFPSIRTPGETDVLKAVENNFSKPPFDVTIRFLYLAPQNIFNEGVIRRAMVGAFNQYGTLHLNSFGQNFDMATMGLVWFWPHLFTKTRVKLRQQRILDFYRNRSVPVDSAMGQFLSSHFLNWNSLSKSIELNTEALATLFHPPTKAVLTAPHIKRVESRKAGPSAGLQIFGDDDALDKFQS
ncbi:MAG: hypothetical protein Q8O87_01760 [bacterium]|nr:hypothetical protein [bacterium]